MQVQFKRATGREIAAVRQQGFERWLTAQMNVARSTPAVQWMEQNGYSDTGMKKQYTPHWSGRRSG